MAAMVSDLPAQDLPETDKDLWEAVRDRQEVRRDLQAVGRDPQGTAQDLPAMDKDLWEAVRDLIVTDRRECLRSSVQPRREEKLSSLV